MGGSCGVGKGRILDFGFDFKCLSIRKITVDLDEFFNMFS